MISIFNMLYLVGVQSLLPIRKPALPARQAHQEWSRWRAHGDFSGPLSGLSSTSRPDGGHPPCRMSGVDSENPLLVHSSSHGHWFNLPCLYHGRQILSIRSTARA